MYYEKAFLIISYNHLQIPIYLSAKFHQNLLGSLAVYNKQKTKSHSHL